MKTRVKKVFLIASSIIFVSGLAVGLSLYILVVKTGFPVFNVGADLLREVIGQDTVMWIESKYYKLQDNWMSYQTKDVEVVVNPDQQQALSSRMQQIQSISAQYPEAEAISYKEKPADIEPLIISPSVQGEGQWKAVHESLDGLYQTSIRPDSARIYSSVDLVAIDLSKIDIRIVLGNAFLDVDNRLGTGSMPDEIKSRAIACFNGGFLPRHEPEGGIIIDGRIRMPMHYNKATILVFEDKSVRIVNWTPEYEEELALSDKKIMFARQNQPILMYNSIINNEILKWGMVANYRSEYEVEWALNPETRNVLKYLIECGLLPSILGSEEWMRNVPAANVNNRTDRGLCAWRSAIGISNDGFLIYAAGNMVTAQTLAYALKLASCHSAMHLDMNISNIAFNYYVRNNGNADIRSINPRLSSSLVGCYYRGGYNHDFFCLTYRDE